MPQPQEQFPNSHPIVSAWLEAVRPYAVETTSHSPSVRSVNNSSAMAFDTLLRQREIYGYRDPLQQLSKKVQGANETLLDRSRRHELVPVLRYFDALEQGVDEEARHEAIFTSYKGLYKELLDPKYNDVDQAGTGGRLAELAVGLMLYYPYKGRPDNMFVSALPFQDRALNLNQERTSHDGVYLDIDKDREEVLRTTQVQIKAGLNEAAFSYTPDTAIIIASLDLDPLPFLPPVRTPRRGLGKKLLSGILPRLLFHHPSTYGFRDNEIPEALTEVSIRLHNRLSTWHVDGKDRLDELSRILRLKRAGAKATYKCLEKQ